MSGPGGFRVGRNTDEDDLKLKEYSLEEVELHNSEDDLWVVLYGRIYDLTDFGLDHPGGVDPLVDVAATDVAKAFEDVMHTDKARKMAKKWLVGRLKDAHLENLFKKPVDDFSDADTGASTLNAFVTFGFLAVAVGVAYQFYIKPHK